MKKKRLLWVTALVSVITVTTFLVSMLFVNAATSKVGIYDPNFPVMQTGYVVYRDYELNSKGVTNLFIPDIAVDYSFDGKKWYNAYFGTNFGDNNYFGEDGSIIDLTNKIKTDTIAKGPVNILNVNTGEKETVATTATKNNPIAVDNALVLYIRPVASEVETPFTFSKTAVTSLDEFTNAGVKKIIIPASRDIAPTTSIGFVTQKWASDEKYTATNADKTQIKGQLNDKGKSNEYVATNSYGDEVHTGLKLAAIDKQKDVIYDPYSGILYFKRDKYVERQYFVSDGDVFLGIQAVPKYDGSDNTDDVITANELNDYFAMDQLFGNNFANAYNLTIVYNERELDDNGTILVNDLVLNEAGVNGLKDGSLATKAVKFGPMSKVAKLSIPAKPKAPKVYIDYANSTFKNAKATMEYAVKTDADGEGTSKSLDWQKTANGEILWKPYNTSFSVSDIVDEYTTEIAFRTAATMKAQPSLPCNIKITNQEKPGVNPTIGNLVNNNVQKSVVLTIDANATTVPALQYRIVKANGQVYKNWANMGISVNANPTSTTKAGLWAISGTSAYYNLSTILKSSVLKDLNPATYPTGTEEEIATALENAQQPTIEFRFKSVVDKKDTTKNQVASKYIAIPIFEETKATVPTITDSDPKIKLTDSKLTLVASDGYAAIVSGKGKTNMAYSSKTWKSSGTFTATATKSIYVVKLQTKDLISGIQPLSAVKELAYGTKPTPKIAEVVVQDIIDSLLLNDTENEVVLDIPDDYLAQIFEAEAPNPDWWRVPGAAIGLTSDYWPEEGWCLWVMKLKSGTETADSEAMKIPDDILQAAILKIREIYVSDDVITKGIINSNKMLTIPEGYAVKLDTDTPTYSASDTTWKTDSQDLSDMFNGIQKLYVVKLPMSAESIAIPVVREYDKTAIEAIMA